MTEQAVADTSGPVIAGTGRSPHQDDPDPAPPRAGVRVRSALLRLDGTFEPPHLAVDGEVDLSTLDTFAAALSSVLDRSSGDVWVDVERLGFIDVGGLRALAAAACRLELQGRRLVLRSVAPHLARLMDLVGWSQISGLLMLARDEIRAPELSQTGGTPCLSWRPDRDRRAGIAADH
ncbi:STAS domain-containing protein [Actinomadura sp. GTD37]|uniref:STAS domain-containing protein n=1 Tax=Actinomadura sp. GTD37 TaxID=1778030 RepID=UPI0035BFBF94